jgi:hypothetical protein
MIRKRYYAQLKLAAQRLTNVILGEPGLEITGKDILDRIEAAERRAVEAMAQEQTAWKRWATLRHGYARLVLALEECKCQCGPSVQPPHALKCARCRALERHYAEQFGAEMNLSTPLPDVEVPGDPT